MSLFGPLLLGRRRARRAEASAMSMIEDDVANVNTTGYKGATARVRQLVTGE